MRTNHPISTICVMTKSPTKSATKPTEAALKREVQAMRIELAGRLLSLRGKFDLSQARLAELAGVDRKTINRIENGHFSPALDTLVRLSSALSVTPASLLK